MAEPTLPRYVAAQRQGESAWRITWEHREKLSSELAAWFRELAAEGREPAERVVLGRGVGLPEKTAFALARFRVAEICRMSTGDPDQMPDFLCVEPPCRGGGRGAGQHTRPVVVVAADGTVVRHPSIAAVAAADGVTPQTAARRVRRGLPSRGGRVAF